MSLKNPFQSFLNDKCKECDYICSEIRFQQNFKNWTSGNDDIDEFIQGTQLSTHDKYEVSKKALEWIPYNRFCNIKYNEKIGVFRANWIDGYIYGWDNENWVRSNENMLVALKNLNNPKNITLEFMNKIKSDYEFYGITQDPQTKNYMVVLCDKCKKCDYICNAIHFQQNFDNWTSGNDDIDEFIQGTQLLEHTYYYRVNALEWIPYNRFCNIKYNEKIGVFRANWIDGYIYERDNENWVRSNENMLVALKNLNNPKNITLESMNKVYLMNF
ncbi:kinase-like domain-containing protein [Rhizophagus irregularis DAOM 181602=DAOM 197198]|uniref:Protein kinase domain-containing protein n=1 Tax=Rhizophagus irregularis (strain DAOM 197198w) TaxID=1432141 RepID=A0A015JRM5_RHIIW|nr:hypothetical protein RirG_204920 [Rhizophagus irregularis DAOM 197198w]GBC31037.2 kinase-like domain-containing protein [Rhizophagus irregularis DAOM 181602=DAOM 197198]